MNAATASSEKSLTAVKDDMEYIRALLFTMYYEQSEHLHSDFSEAYIKFRNVVCEWMIDVCEYFGLHITTTHAAISYLDRLQPNEKFSRFEWQMVAICCIIIASKYNECEEHVPPLQKLGEITQQTIGNDVLLEYELFALKRMAWKLNARTTMAFLCSYCELGLLTPQDIQLLLNQKPPRYSSVKKSVMTSSSTAGVVADENEEDPTVKVAMMLRAMRHKVQKLGTKTLLDVRFKSMQSSAVAAAIVFYARRCCCLFSRFGVVLPSWSEELTKMTFHDPLKHRATIEALALLFELEGESRADFYAIFPRPSSPSSAVIKTVPMYEVNTSVWTADQTETEEETDNSFATASSSSTSGETGPSKTVVVDSAVSHVSPAKAEVKTVLMVSPAPGTTMQGKESEQSPVSMANLFETISP